MDPAKEKYRLDTNTHRHHSQTCACAHAHTTHRFSGCCSFTEGFAASISCLSTIHQSLGVARKYLWRMHSHADLFRPHWHKSNHRPEQAQGTNNFPGPGHKRNRLEGTSCWHTSCLLWRRKRTVRFHRLQAKGKAIYAKDRHEAHLRFRTVEGISVHIKSSQWCLQAAQCGRDGSWKGQGFKVPKSKGESSVSGALKGNKAVCAQIEPTWISGRTINN